MKAIRLIFAFAGVASAALGLVAGEVRAAPPADTNATPQTQPASKPDNKPDKTAKPAHKSETHKSETHKADGPKSDKSAKPSAKSEKSAEAAPKTETPAKSKTRGAAHATAKTAPGPMMLSVPPGPVSSTASVPPPGVIGNGTDVPRGAPPFTPSTLPLRPSAAAPPPPPARSAPALAMAASANTSPLDLSAVKQAVELAHKGRPDEATNVEGNISDPVARKLVEWVILRSDDGGPAISRAMPPSSPPIRAGRASATLRRRAEAVLWQERPRLRGRSSSFSEPIRRTPPRDDLRWRVRCSREGDRAGAQAAVHEAWRKDGFSADVEAQARDLFAGLITPADDKARMDARFYVEDDDAGLRAAHRLGRSKLAIAKARAAVINQAGNAKALLEAVPAEAAGTIPAICSAASSGCAAPTRSPRPRSGWWRRRTTPSTSAISISGGSSAG